ncbi:MAG: hypothetical protein OEW99_13525 [Gammaproteobacteria bacterium]|nr:hypothetical protein [Gammaproteobacteria bacterium]MDH5659401.1 hypothetical protein [Gammaproteobacteria bacterium]
MNDFVMLKILLLLPGLLFSQQIIADSFNLIINGKALHENNNFNEENWGLGFEYNFAEEKKWIHFINGGFFKDSHLNNSNYLGGGSKRRLLLGMDKEGWHIDTGITAFIMTRKDYNNEKPFFGILPYFSIGIGEVALNATYIPAISPKLVALWFFQASVQIAEW